MLAQARTFLEKLSKTQKIIVASAVATVVAGVVALVVIVNSEPERSVLFNNLESNDAASIVEYLKSNNISYKLGADNGTTAIYISKEKVNETRLALANQGLPAESYVGYELFDKTNLGMSEFVQKLNYRRALEGELQRTIKSMSEVRDVKVHIVIPEKSLLKKDERQPTAAVKLTLKGGRSLSRLSIEGIQNIVASSVEGLSVDKVTVTDNQGHILSNSSIEENSLAGLTSTQYEQQKKIEEYYSAKVQALLDPALGPDNSKVKLNTEIDFDQLQVNKTDYDPDRQVERSEQSIIDYATNIDTSFVPGINEKRDRSNEVRNYEISKADSHYIKGIGGIKRLTVTAIVNETMTIEKTPQGLDTVISSPRTEEELNGLREAIKNVVGYDERRGDEVNVLCVPFAEQLSDKIFEINENNKIISTKWYEKEDNQKLLLLALALIVTAIVMFRLIHAKFVKDKMRIAMGLPEKLEPPVLDKYDASMLALPDEHMNLEDEEDLEEEEETDDNEEFLFEDPEVSALEDLLDDTEDEIEEIELEADDMLISPDELPEQLLLEGELEEMDIFNDEMEFVGESGRIEDNLLERARAALASQQASFGGELDESDLIKMELKEKVHQFITGQPEAAVRILRVFLSQDNDSTKTT